MHGAPPLGALAFSYRKIVPFIQVCQLKRPNVMCRCLVHVCVCARVCVCACVGRWVRGCVYVSVSLPLVSRACSQRLRRYAADASTLVRPSAPTPTKFVIDFSPECQQNTLPSTCPDDIHTLHMRWTCLGSIWNHQSSPGAVDHTRMGRW